MYFATVAFRAWRKLGMSSWLIKKPLSLLSKLKPIDRIALLPYVTYFRIAAANTAKLFGARKNHPLAEVADPKNVVERTETIVFRFSGYA